MKDIEHAYEKVSEASDVVLMEGTGHCAVGSVVGVNNAQVAGMLGASMILIANGGLGSAFDELGELLCAHVSMQLSRIASYCDSNLS